MTVAGLPATAAAMAVLYIASLILLKEPAQLSRGAVIFLLSLAGLFVLQLLPVAPLLFPHTAGLRTTHGVGQIWPATADTFYTVRMVAQVATYVMAGLLVLRLRQAGLRTSYIITGILLVLFLAAAYALVQVFVPIEAIPFYGRRPAMDTNSASGTLVNRDSFGGLMAVALVLAAVRAYGRLTWPTTEPSDGRRSRWLNRIEGGIGWGMLAALFAVALVLSKSRGAVLSAAGGLLLTPLFYRGRASIAGVGGLCVLGAVGVFVANPAGLLQRFGYLDPFELTAEKRWTMFVTTVQAALHQPVFGFGWGTHPLAYHPFQPASLPGQIHHAHNEYINVFFEAGIVGLALLLAGLGFWFVRVWRAQKAVPGPDRTTMTSALGVASVLLIHSLVDFDLRITSIGILWAGLLGLGASAVRGGTARTSWPVPAIALFAVAALGFLRPEPPAAGGEPALLRALALSPYDYRAGWILGRLKGDPNRLAKAADLWPAHADLQREAGLLFWDNGDPGRAAICLRRLFEQDPGAVEGVLEEIWDPSIQPTEYESLLPGTSGAHAMYAAALAKRGLWQTGFDGFLRRVGTRPEDAAWYDYFAAQLEALGQWGMEATIRDRRLNLRSDVWAYGAAARAWMKLGALDRALEHAQTASRIDPTTAAWPGLRGEILESRKDLRGAIDAYSEAAARAPADMDWPLRRGLLHLAEKTYAAAESDLREVLRSRPAERKAVLGLARALAGQSQPSNARILLDGWLRKNETDAEAAALRNSLPER